MRESGAPLCAPLCAPRPPRRQVMAIGTLGLCYNNHGVFTGTAWPPGSGWVGASLTLAARALLATPAGVVKMRRGEVAKIMYNLQGMGDAARYFAHYVHVIRAKAQVRRSPWCISTSPPPLPPTHRAPRSERAVMRVRRVRRSQGP